MPRSRSSRKQSYFQPSSISHAPAQLATHHVIAAFCFPGIIACGILAILFFSNKLIIGGVPSAIILQFLQDEIARNAYFEGDRAALHQRLDDLGIEEQIKAHYRSRFSDEEALDQHIHQLFYDRTGYVGEAYQVRGDGTLVKRY